MNMTPAQAAERLSKTFGIEISESFAAEALNKLATYSDLQFETLEGKFKVKGDCYTLLSVINNDIGNGAWSRYIDQLKQTYKTIVVQSVVNKRLYYWFLRNGFKQTKKHKDWVIWHDSSI